MTEGVNLKACWNFANGVIDLNQIYTNDVGAILRTYGVEAARTSIIKEMSGVFSVYGIGVDFRHLTVIADYMVRRSSLCSSNPLLTNSRCTADVRGSLQAFQPNRSLQQLVPLPQSVLRDDGQLCRRGSSVRRFRRPWNALGQHRSRQGSQERDGSLWGLVGGGGVDGGGCNER